MEVVTMAHETELLQQMIDNTDAAVYIKDEEGRFLLVNRRVTEMLKKSKEELLGRTDYDFVPKELADRLREYDRKVADTGIPSNYRDTVTMPGGRFTIVDHKFPVKLEGHQHAVGGIVIEVKEAP
jgi:PAS domain S-box-containing protein